MTQEDQGQTQCKAGSLLSKGEICHIVLPLVLDP